MGDGRDFQLSLDNDLVKVDIRYIGIVCMVAVGNIDCCYWYDLGRFEGQVDVVVDLDGCVVGIEVPQDASRLDSSNTQSPALQRASSDIGRVSSPSIRVAGTFTPHHSRKLQPLVPFISGQEGQAAVRPFLGHLPR